jgi:hypothetical protein
VAYQLPLLTDRAIQIIADNKFRAAIEAGEFDICPAPANRSQASKSHTIRFGGFAVNCDASS